MLPTKNRGNSYELMVLDEEGKVTWAVIFKINEMMIDKYFGVGNFLATLAVSIL